MSKRIVYTRPDGGMSIVVPAPGVTQHVLPADAADVHWIDAADIPTDRTYRNAWRHQAGVIHHDMAHARDIHRDRIREHRAPALAALDVAYQRADEAGDADGKKRIAAQKQALRDATDHADIEAARTPVELAAVWPLGDQ